MADELRAVYHETIVPQTSTGVNTSYLDLPGAHPTRGKPMKARVTLENAAIYYLLNGEAPISDPTGKGHLMSVGETMIIEGHRDIANFRCIEAVVGSLPKVKVTLYFP